MRPSDADIAAMSIEQRLALIERLWASIPDAPGSPEEIAAFDAELGRRLAEDEAHPEQAVDALDYIAHASRRLA